MNKPRLIDANTLLDKLPYPTDYAESEFYGKILDVIEAMPTAYDIDKVAEQLEEQFHCNEHCQTKFYQGLGCKACLFGQVIEIVKGNYSENPNSSSEVAE